MNNYPQEEVLDVQKLLKELTLEEKASLCSGRDFWNSKSIERLTIPSISVSDGPHGLRKVLTTTSGFNRPATSSSTCFPTASALGASWNKKLMYEIGCALARECISLGVNILLGPGVNIKRTPLCGRNFEYFSEDPFLTAECAKEYIRGVQDQGVGTSLKHFACNNQEYRRFSIDAVVDERTLREIYLRAFETVIHTVDPWTVMSSYNSLNGELVSENKRLLTDILRKEWGYKGLVVSDWGSIYNRVKALEAGCDLQMPGKGHTDDNKIIQAVKTGELDTKRLDESVTSYLRLLNKVFSNKNNTAGYNPEEHHTLARKAAAESVVLLKNEDTILPVNRGSVKNIAVIGEFALTPRIQGKGSSLVNAYKIDIPLDEIKKRAGSTVEVNFASGYSCNDEDNRNSINEAKEIAAKADRVIIFTGTGENNEAEGIDRKNIDLPHLQNLLVSEITEVNRNCVVLVSTGSAVTMPWHNKVKAIVHTWLSGQASAGAIADILFGIINPSGKLSESFPLRLEDTPAYTDYPGDNGKAIYNENLYIGYRYYDKRNMDVLFPFGFGLSYTNFKYSDITVDPDKINDTDELHVRVKIKNTGSVYGQEVVQLYIRDVESAIGKPEKELKEFAKIGLEPGEEKRITFTLNKDAFTHYDVKRNKWCVEPGVFEILIGSSSRDIRLKARVEVNTEDTERPVFHRHSYMADFYNNPAAKRLLQEWLNKMSNNSVDLDGYESLKLEGIKNVPLSKFILFMQETITDAELDIFLENINTEV